MRIVNVKGIYDVPGRGRIFTADRREHEFELLELKENDRVMIKDEEWIINHLECFRAGNLIKQVVGICVRKPND